MLTWFDTCAGRAHWKPVEERARVPVAYIGLGSNLGAVGRSPGEMVREAIASLAALGSVVAQSSLYRTEPVGFAAQPSFINAAAALDTGLEPEALLDELLALERRSGRDRSRAEKNGPRELDLDLLMVGGRRHTSERLTLPHPRLAERRFVLAPLAEIAPGLAHPLLGRTMQELLQALSDEGENGVAAVQRI